MKKTVKVLIIALCFTVLSLSTLLFASCKYITKKPLRLELRSEIFNIDLNEKTAYLVVENAVTEYDFSDKFTVVDGARFIVCTDKQGNNIITSKKTDIIEGDNIFYVIVTNGNDIANYTVTVRRRPIYLVMFETLGGDFIKTQKVEENCFAMPPTTISKKGYVFISWDYDFDQPITKNTTITASWSIITYKITYELNGGSNVTANKTSYTVEDDVILSSPTKKGYTFTGWSNDGKIEKGSVGDKTFTASWSPTKYKIMYVLNGGINSSENWETYTIEDNIKLSSPTKKGYTFTGWSNGGQIEKGSVGDKTFTASWSIITYKITYELNGGSNVTANKTSYTVEDDVILSSPTKKGYTFTGWSNDGKIEKGSVGDKTFTASWSVDVKLSRDGKTVTGLNNAVAELVILSEYNGVQIERIEKGAFKDCESLNKITVPFVGERKDGNGKTHFAYIFGAENYEDSNKFIPSQLHDVEITKCKYVQDFSFYGCVNISKVAIPFGVLGIGESAFSQSGLKDIVLPNSVTEIKKYAFLSCLWLTNVTISNKTTYLGIGCFSGCGNLLEVVIPNSVTKMEDLIFYNCSGLKSVFIGDNVTEIGYYAFNNCSDLIEVKMGDGVTSIGESAFHGCKNLMNIKLPNSIVSIGESAFFGCANLKNINIPNKLNYLSKNIFFSCGNLLKIDIPDSVEYIGENAFTNCHSLVNVRISNNLISIGGGAFSYCENLVFNEYDNMLYIGSEDNPYLILIKVKREKETLWKIRGETRIIYGQAFSACRTLTSINIPNNVVFIGEYAFYGCNNLNNIKMSSNIKAIADFAFSGCTNLSEVNYKGTEEQWNKIAIGMYNENLTNAKRNYI